MDSYDQPRTSCNVHMFPGKFPLLCFLQSCAAKFVYDFLRFNQFKVVYTARKQQSSLAVSVLGRSRTVCSAHAKTIFCKLRIPMILLLFGRFFHSILSTVGEHRRKSLKTIETIIPSVLHRFSRRSYKPR